MLLFFTLGPGTPLLGAIPPVPWGLHWGELLQLWVLGHPFIIVLALPAPLLELFLSIW